MERALIAFEASTYRVSFGNPVYYECRLYRRFESFYSAPAHEPMQDSNSLPTLRAV